MFLETIIHFNIAALFIFGITIFYIVYRKLYKAYSSFIFLIINILYLILCAIDILMSYNVFGGVSYRVGMFVYYLVKYIAAICYLLYIIILTNSQDIVKGNKRNMLLFSLPFIITFGFLVSNIFNGYIYYFEGDTYYRGSLIFVFYGLSFIYVIVGFVWLLIYRKVFSFSDNVALMCVYAFSVAALIIQYFFPDVLIELLSTSLAFLLLSITVERSQLIMDSKTGLKNKKIFDRIIYSCFKRKKEYGVVLFNFKNYLLIYDKYRYDIAIKNIRGMASFINTAFLPDVNYDCFYLGGGIIALLTENLEDADTLVSRIEETLTDGYNEKITINVDYTLFVSRLPSDFKTIEDFNQFIYNFSDSFAKGKRVIRLSDVQEDNRHKVAVKLDEIINNVIKNRDILVEFQPVYELNVKKFTAVETLARISTPDMGVITAEQFIPYAEKKDKVYDIDMIIIDKVYDYVNKRKFQELGIKIVAINLSVQTLCNNKFLKDLDKLEKKYNVNREIIYFEIKEREKSTFNQKALEIIKLMMKRGYLFSLDNYGIGCMPVDNLAKIPFMNVKFDNTFAKSCDNKETCVVIDNTIKLLKNLAKTSICAGIETEVAAKTFEGLSPDFVQGFYYSKPLPLEELIVFLKNNNKQEVVS